MSIAGPPARCGCPWTQHGFQHEKRCVTRDSMNEWQYTPRPGVPYENLRIEAEVKEVATANKALRAEVHRLEGEAEKETRRGEEGWLKYREACVEIADLKVQLAKKNELLDTASIDISFDKIQIADLKVQLAKSQEMDSNGRKAIRALNAQVLDLKEDILVLESSLATKNACLGDVEAVERGWKRRAERAEEALTSNVKLNMRLRDRILKIRAMTND